MRAGLILAASLLMAAVGRGQAIDTAQEAQPPPDDATIAAGLELPPFRSQDLDLWRSWIRPSESESLFASVDWIPTFADGLKRSAEVGKPLLFWAMNGHPLGCT